MDTSLEILEVRPDDAGTYFCNLETYGEPLDQEHTLDVLVPPSVQVGPNFKSICSWNWDILSFLLWLLCVQPYLLAGTAVQWQVCRPIWFNDHLGVPGTGQPHAQGVLDQTGETLRIIIMTSQNDQGHDDHLGE